MARSLNAMTSLVIVLGFSGIHTLTIVVIVSDSLLLSIFIDKLVLRGIMWSILQRCLNFPRTLSFVSNLGCVDLAAWANYLFPQFHSYEKSNSWSLDTQATMLCATVLTFLTAFISKETSWNPFLAGLTWDTDQIKKSILTAAEGRDHLLSA